MFNRLEWMIAGRYMRARRKEGAISVITMFSLIGIFLGVGTLIVVMSVMNGFRAELVGQILGAQPHVIVWGYAKDGIKDYEGVTEQLRAAPGVTRAEPFMRDTVMVSGPSGRSTGVQVRGLKPEGLRTLERIANPEWSNGRVDDFGEGVAIGDGLAAKLGVGIGDRVNVLTAPNKTSPMGNIPSRRNFTVSYIFRSGYYPDDNAFFFVPLDKAQGLLNRRGQVDGIELNVADPDALDAGNADPQTLEIIQRIGPEAIPSPSNWKRSNGGFLSALDTERAAMFVILSLVILVAALNIISGLTMLVKEKGQNIGIMRTFGMSRGAILRIFFLCGASIGVVGTILGVIGGVLFTVYIRDIQAALEWLFGIPLWPVEVRGLSQIPTILETSDVVNIVVVALILSLLATWFPARRAARMDPVEALRYE